MINQQKPIMKQIKHLALLVLFVGIILAASQLAMWAAICGNSGNTFWSQNLPAVSARVAADATNVFWTSGTTVSTRENGTGAGYVLRDYSFHCLLQEQHEMVTN